MLRTQCDPNHVLINFQIFLSDKAEQWYWEFVRKERQINFPTIKYAITREFGKLESDHEVLMRISNRKQAPKESFDDFYSAIMSMNLRMCQSVGERTLVDIMMRNANTNLQLLLFSANVQSSFELRDRARHAEKVLAENKIQFPIARSTRTINEIQSVMNIISTKALSDFKHRSKCKSRFLKRKMYRKLINAFIY